MSKISLRSAPELKRVVLAAYPDYRKHNAYLSVFPENGIGINSYWDGGSRDEYAIINLATYQRKGLPTSTHPYFDVARYGIQGENELVSVSPAGNVTLKTLPENFALVQAGTFCGKPATAHIYVPAANMARLLETGKDKLYE